MNCQEGGGELGNRLGLANLTTKPFQQFQGCWTVYGDKQRCIAVDVGLRQAMQKPEERLLNVRLFTLSETSSRFAPENPWLEHEFPLGMVHFQRQTVSQ